MACNISNPSHGHLCWCRYRGRRITTKAANRSGSKRPGCAGGRSSAADGGEACRRSAAFPRISRASSAPLMLRRFRIPGRLVFAVTIANSTVVGAFGAATIPARVGLDIPRPPQCHPGVRCAGCLREREPGHSLLGIPRRRFDPSRPDRLAATAHRIETPVVVQRGEIPAARSSPKCFAGIRSKKPSRHCADDEPVGAPAGFPGSRSAGFRGRPIRG